MGSLPRPLCRLGLGWSSKINSCSRSSRPGGRLEREQSPGPVWVGTIGETMKTQKAVRMKDGSVAEKGSPVRFCEEQPSWCIVTANGREYRVRVTSAFRAPSIDELMEQEADGVVESIAGNMTEPDGWCADGSPSWLLALGVI